MKKLTDVNVSEIKKFYCARYQLKSGGSQNHHEKNNVPRIPSPQLQERWHLVSKNPLYQDPNVQSYKFNHLKGMLVHMVLRALFHDVLPDLPEEIGTPVSPVDPLTLCYALNWHACRDIIANLQYLRGTYPQVAVFDESLVYAVMQDVRNVIDYLLAKICPLLEQGQGLASILSRYTSVCIEQDGVVSYQGLRIHYKPDWYRVSPEGIYVLDFKAGGLQPGQIVNDRDRVQVLLYAWCLTQHFRQPVKIAIFYTQCNVLWEAEFTKILEQEAQQIVEQFLQYKNLEFNNAHQSRLVEMLSTTIDLASVAWVSPSLLSPSPASRSSHPSS